MRTLTNAAAGDDGQEKPSDKLVMVSLLCGLPGAGKSHLSRALTAALREASHSPLFDRVVVLEYDALAQSLLKEKQQETHEVGNNDEGTETDEDPELVAWRRSRFAALQRLSHLLERHFRSSAETTTGAAHDPQDCHSLLILMDDNFHLRSMRRNVYRACQKAAFAAAAERRRVFFSTVFVDTSFRVCVQRNAARPPDTRVADEVMERLCVKLEPPNSEDNHGCRVTLDSGATETATTTVLRFWSNVLQHEDNTVPPPPLSLEEQEAVAQKAREETLASVLHRYDLLLRSLVGAACRVDAKMYGKLANAARKDILQELKAKKDGLDDVATIVEAFLERLSLHNDNNDKLSTALWQATRQSQETQESEFIE